MFNQPNLSRSAKPWQPNARLVSDDTGRGFAATHWTQQEGPGFAEAGFKPKAADFSADRYQAVVMPLSEKSKTTLRLMGDAESADGFASDDATQREPESPNAHLPFVMDVYGVKPAARKTLQASPTHDEAGDDTQAQAQHDEDARQAQTSEDEVSESEPDVEAADATEAADAAEAESVQATQAEASEELEAQPNAESAQDSEAAHSAEPEQDTQPEQDLAESELITDDSAGEPQALAAEIEEVLAQEPVPPAAPVVVGIAPEEVAQREAEHFAQGLAQGLEQGIAQGERQAREAMQQEVAAQCAVLSAVTHDLNALLQDPQKFFEPLKRLALHVAEHVVMKELSTSTEAIERLVQRCLDELDHPAKGAVVVELNPQDKERLQAQDSALVAGMRLDAVKGMKPGSVRLFANDTVVEDLVEHRLEALARSLLVDVEDWRAKSALAQPEVVAPESESEIEDVEPKDVHS